MQHAFVSASLRQKGFMVNKFGEISISIPHASARLLNRRWKCCVAQHHIYTGGEILLLFPWECLPAREGATGHIISLAITIVSMYWTEAECSALSEEAEECSVWSQPPSWMTHWEEWGAGIIGELVLSADIYGSLHWTFDMNYPIFSSSNLSDIDVVVITILWLRNWGLHISGKTPEATQLVSGRARTWMQVSDAQPRSSLPGKAMSDCWPVCGFCSSLSGTADAKLTKAPCWEQRLIS